MEAKELSILFKKAKELANAKKYNYVKFVFSHLDYAIYYVSMNNGSDMGCTGYPMHIKVSLNGNAEFLWWEDFCTLKNSIKQP